MTALAADVVEDRPETFSDGEGFFEVSVPVQEDGIQTLIETVHRRGEFVSRCWGFRHEGVAANKAGQGHQDQQ